MPIAVRITTRSLFVFFRAPSYPYIQYMCVCVISHHEKLSREVVCFCVYLHSVYQGKASVS